MCREEDENTGEDTGITRKNSHHLLHHGVEREPQLHLRVVGNFKSAMTRQVVLRVNSWGEVGCGLGLQ